MNMNLTTSKGNIYRRSHMTGVVPQSRDQNRQTKITQNPTIIYLNFIYKGLHIGIYLVVSFSFFSSL